MNIVSVKGIDMITDLDFMHIARIISKSATCSRHRVGAVITRDNRIISHGYNGVPKGHVHCNKIFGFDSDSDGHHQWSKENEIHAEANAILWAGRSGISCEGADIYVTMSPCEDCCKLIVASGISRVFYQVEYRHAKEDWWKYLVKSGVSVFKYTESENESEYGPSFKQLS